MSLLLGPLGIQITSTDLVLNAPQNAVPPVVKVPRGTDYESPAPAPSFTAYTLELSPGAYVYAGADATLTKAGLTAFSLVCSPGVYAYAGSPASFKTQVKLTVSPGAYVYSGLPAAFNTAVKFTAAPGVYAYAGSVASFKTARLLALTKGAYAYSGSTAAFTTAYRMPLSPGVYAYAGATATLTYTPGAGAVNYSLTCLPGAYVYTGSSAVLYVGEGAPPAPPPQRVYGGNSAKSYSQYERSEQAAAWIAQQFREEEEISLILNVLFTEGIL